jgi:hypothetical protein
MMRLRRTCAALITSLAIAPAGVTAAPQSPIRPSSPRVVAPPIWSGVLHLPDGRTFVTDGGLSIDVRLAKPATMPSVVLAPASARLFAARLADRYDKEIGLGDLRPGTLTNSFTTPDGVALNGNYIAFLRKVAPATTRLRTKGKADPVIVVTDGQAVALMMPLATPAR